MTSGTQASAREEREWAAAGLLRCARGRKKMGFGPVGSFHFFLTKRFFCFETFESKMIFKHNQIFSEIFTKICFGKLV